MTKNIEIDEVKTELTTLLRKALSEARVIWFFSKIPLLKKIYFSRMQTPGYSNLKDFLSGMIKQLESDQNLLCAIEDLHVVFGGSGAWRWAPGDPEIEKDIQKCYSDLKTLVVAREGVEFFALCSNLFTNVKDEVQMEQLYEIGATLRYSSREVQILANAISKGEKYKWISALIQLNEVKNDNYQDSGILWGYQATEIGLNWLNQNGKSLGH
ncbi:MAG: hypothetical protein KDD25_00175 [Bdellovibrionales bacterium]|nr:hypothetical protein [Bdellovibrionales bacterium]